MKVYSNLKYIEKHLKIAIEIDARGGEGADCGDLGIAYKSLGDYEKSMEYHEKGLNVALEIGHRSGKGN